MLFWRKHNQNSVGSLSPNTFIQVSAYGFPAVIPPHPTHFGLSSIRRYPTYLVELSEDDIRRQNEEILAIILTEMS